MCLFFKGASCPNELTKNVSQNQSNQSIKKCSSLQINKKCICFRSTNTHSVVEYVPRTEMDYGSLLCWATNSVGRQKDPW